VPENLTETRSTVENQQEWFDLLVCYMKMKTYSMWLDHYPDTPYESFELLWPTLFDAMLVPATAAAVKALSEQVTVCSN
jgi:hypothetical protein